MESTKAAEEARAVLEEAERRDPEAHGYTGQDLLAMAELLLAASEFGMHHFEAKRAHDRVVRLSRQIVKDALLTDEEAIKSAGHLAARLVPQVKS